MGWVYRGEKLWTGVRPKECYHAALLHFYYRSICMFVFFFFLFLDLFVSLFKFSYLFRPDKSEYAKMSAEGDKRSVDVQDAAYGIHESSEHVDEKKGNAADRADMYRMGKTQEMTVRRKARSHNRVRLTNMLEKLSLPVHLWLLYDSHGILGVLPQVRCIDARYLLKLTFAVFRQSALLTAARQVSSGCSSSAGWASSSSTPPWPKWLQCACHQHLYYTTNH